MLRIGAQSILAALFLLPLAAAVQGGQYSDPSGFSLSYPEDWVVVSGAAMNMARDNVPPAIKDWMSKNHVGFDSSKVLIVRAAPALFMDNVNVVVDSNQINVSERDATAIADKVRSELNGAGLEIQELTSRMQTYGTRQAVVIEQTFIMPGTEMPIKQRVALFPGGGKTYLVTCTSLPDKFAEVSPTFDQMLASFNAPPPVKRSLNAARIVTFALVGAGVALFILVLKKLTGG